MPLLKHLLYLARLWTGAYMLSDWEAALLVAIFAGIGYFALLPMVLHVANLIVDTETPVK